MDRHKLPDPKTPHDLYLHDIARSLRQLCGDLPDDEDGPVQLREPAAPTVDIRHTGGGWYEVVVDGTPADKVQGQDAAAARAAELRG